MGTISIRAIDMDCWPLPKGRSWSLPPWNYSRAMNCYAKGSFNHRYFQQLIFLKSQTILDMNPEKRSPWMRSWGTRGSRRGTRKSIFMSWCLHLAPFSIYVFVSMPIWNKLRFLFQRLGKRKIRINATEDNTTIELLIRLTWVI